MRMEELSNSRYIKGTDTVEKYLLELVRSYFNDNDIAVPSSREFIIRKAVTRMKEEFKYENIGVLSVTLADGIARTGPVNITLADLGAEPVITPKLSAFNVNFGDQANTACEGNDPRLSDARDPNPHTHNIQDINGLEGRLSTLLSLVNRINGYGHVHANSNVLDKLVYSGMASTIDLNFIDTLIPAYQLQIDNLKKEMDDVINTDIPARLGDIDSKLNNITSSINQAQTNISSVHDSYLAEAKQYADEKIAPLSQQFNGNFDGYITQQQLEASTMEALSYVGSMRCDMVQLSNSSTNPNYEESATYTYSTKILDSILNKISDRGAVLKECIIDIMVCEDIIGPVSGNVIRQEYSKLPYCYVNSSGILSGTLIGGIDYDNESVVFSYKMPTPIISTSPLKRQKIPSEVKSLIIEIKFYSKRKAAI